jgi:hypothetical protein
MATTSGRFLDPQDILYRVIDPPPFWDASGIKPDAFEDPHVSNPETLSFFVKEYVGPRDALTAISKRRQVRRNCGTDPRYPTPEEMFAAGYRVAELSAAIILDAVASPDNRLAIEPVDGGQVSRSGHLGVYNGHEYSVTLSRQARMLTAEETLGSP